MRAQSGRTQNMCRFGMARSAQIEWTRLYDVPGRWLRIQDSTLKATDSAVLLEFHPHRIPVSDELGDLDRVWRESYRTGRPAVMDRESLENEKVLIAEAQSGNHEA